MNGCSEQSIKNASAQQVKSWKWQPAKYSTVLLPDRLSESESESWWERDQPSLGAVKSEQCKLRAAGQQMLRSQTQQHNVNNKKKSLSKL